MRTLLYILALAACGRVGFDAASRDGVADARTTSGDALVAQCAPSCKGNELCVTEVGQCGGVGQCNPIVTSCPDTIEPVCGCDGVTYDNACFAQLSRASIDYVGTCVPPYIPPCSPPCSASEYCDLTNCQGPGTCMPEPAVDEQCPDLLVCGCDGKSYGNSCDARRAGVDVAGIGNCAI